MSLDPDQSSAVSPASESAPQRWLAAIVPGWSENLGPALWILFFARIVNVFAFSSAFPFLARYFAHDRGLSSTSVGTIYLVQGVSGALFQLAGGMLADRFGRREVIIWSLGARAVLMVGLGALVANDAPIALIIGAVFSNSLLAGASLPATDALVADHSPPDRRIAAFAHQRVAINTGWALGPLVGGAIAGHMSFAYMFFFSAPLVLVGAFVTSLLPKAPPTLQKRQNPIDAMRSTLDDPALRWHMLGALFVFMLAAQLIVTMSLDGSARLHFTESELGLLWTTNGLMVVFAQMPVARIVKRMGTDVALVAGALIYAAGFAAIGFSTTWWGVWLCVVTVTSGELLNGPAQQTSVSTRAKGENMTRALALLGLTTMLGRAIGPQLGGIVHDSFPNDPVILWGMLAGLGVAAAAVYMHPALRRRRGP